MSGALPTAAASARLIASGEASSVELVRTALDRIAAGNGALHAFLEVFGDRATEQASKIDAARASGESLGPLAGVPVALKDNICLDHGKTTCGSRFLEEYRSPYTATAAQKLIDAGAVIVGKTNLDEFAMGSSCEHSAFGPTRNPWDTDRVPGGSSGGSAAAVASGMVPLALGSDTGGSVRQPASLCGVVGFKPTYGRVSRYGLVAFASSLDQIGPLCRSVEDAALCLSVIGGEDPLDATSATHGLDGLLDELDESPKQARVGVPKQAWSDAVDPLTREVFEHAVAVLEGAGIAVVEIDLARIDEGIAAYYLVATAEASSNLARFDGVRYGRRASLEPGASLEAMYTRSRSEGFGDEVKRRILLGTHVLSSGYYDAYYTTALKARRLIKQDYDRAFESGVDAVLMPASPSPAFRLGEKTGDPLALYLEDVFTVGANMAGLPGITIPAGFAGEGGTKLPVGVQLIGPAFGESLLLRLARVAEEALGVEETVAPVGTS